MKAIRSISAIMLACLVLVSSTSFMMGMHLCMGEVQNIAFFSKADGCKEEERLPPCHKHTTAPCCDDETVVHQGNDFKASAATFHVPVPGAVDAAELHILISEIIPAAPLSRVKYFNYDPPLRSCDRTVEHRVFLI
jgi:hypothetical protein